MFEAKSADIRRFFDLLGSIFCAFLVGFAVSDIFHSRQSYRFSYLPLFILGGSIIYLSFYRLVWRFVKTRFLFGYANFFLISFLGVSTAALVFAIGNLIIIQDTAVSISRFEFFMSRVQMNNVVLFYWATSLPMAFFWLLGVLTAWKFSKPNFFLR